MLNLIVLSGGIATFCAVVLALENPLCVWLEWTIACRDERDEDARQGRD